MHVRITGDVIEPAAVLRLTGSASDGAGVLFVGTVRDHNDGRPVGGVRYEAYAEMAETELRAIATEAADRFGTDRIAAVHRTGELAVGDVSIAVAVSSPHRAEAFDAARYIMEQVKQRLPVWKHEHYADGDTRWLDGVMPPVQGLHG